MDEALTQLYAEHIQELQTRCEQVIVRENLSALVIHAGKAHKIFLDDIDYPFHVNPHFKYWLPLTQTPNCWLIVNGQDKPTLIFHQPDDFWHQSTTISDQFWVPFFDIKIIQHARDIESLLPYDKHHLAYLGEHLDVAKALGFQHINPEQVLNYLHYYRAYKTDYEQTCLRRANMIAYDGHQAAHQAFFAEESEFNIGQQYLLAVNQSANSMPYPNIVALNENAAVLHYNGNATKAPNKHRSLLIDAGASYHGYGADITRTYAQEKSLFSHLIVQLNKLALMAADGLKPGMSYLALHQVTFEQIGQLLIDAEIIQADLDESIEKGIISCFFPHGLGHHLGLQTHDVGGYMVDERGTQLYPPEPFTFLRTTRKVEARQVFTIEPGIYFIESLLARLKASKNSRMINWSLIEQLKPYGGLRIEDNIIVHQSHNENITRFNL